MSDILCASTEKLYHVILCEGGTMEDAEKAAKSIRQPVKGYYPITEIYKFIEKRRAKQCRR